MSGLFSQRSIDVLAGALAKMQRASNPSESSSLGQMDETAIRNLLARIPNAAKKKADKLFKMWTEREADEDIITNIVWPTNQVLIGTGRKIGYTSDKWQRVGQTRDYIHDFDLKKPPRIIVEYSSDLNVTAKKNNKIIKPPKNPILVSLGYALDIEFLADGIVQQIDWKNGTLPHLLVDTERNLLIIQQENGAPAVLLDSPVVEITARGIEN